MKQDFSQLFRQILDDDQIYIEEPLKKHTTFRIGGPADCLVCPRSIDEIRSIIEICKSEGIPFFVLGNGSNLLVSDRGYRGVIIQIYKNFSNITVAETQITVQAGALLGAAARAAYDASLAGMEFAAGIPGTMGGAVYMNAGAYGGEMKDIVESVRVLTGDGEFLELDNEACAFGYRSSAVSKKGYIVLEAVLKLQSGSREQIKARMDELKEKRVTRQPLEYPSAGSTFKRPEGYFAGKLIMDAGLRGKQIGGAQVSEKHCGFVINRGGATAADVKDLIQYIKEEVERQYQVALEPEVKMLGE